MATNWQEERMKAQSAMRAGLARGNKPRNVEQSVIAFVRGYRQRHNAQYNTHPVKMDNDGDVMYSYATPVAYRDDDGDIMVSAVTYSPTTAQHISKLCHELRNAGYVQVGYDCRLAPDHVWGGRIQRDETAFQRWSTGYVPNGSVMPMWTSSNDIWSIHHNWDGIGQDAIPFIITRNGWAIAHVFAHVERADGGSTIGHHGGQLPAYVHAQALAMAGAE